MSKIKQLRLGRRTAQALVAVLAVMALGQISMATANAGTAVPGHSGSRVDADGNGYPDQGVVVSGNYEEVYSDSSGDCTVRVNYRGAYNDDPYLDTGWIQNHYRCVAPDGSVTTYNYLIVHESDARYTGNPDWTIWGTWELQVMTQGGAGATGNLVRPAGHIG